MMKNRQKGLRRSLWVSALAIVLCCAMLVGTTFAWFTDSVSSSGNRIQAGTLNITATAAGYDQNGSTQITVPDGVIAGNTLIFGAAEDIEAEGAKPVISESNWEPGQRNAKLLTVTNSGSLAAKIKLEFNVTNGELTDALWFDFIQVNENSATGQFTQRDMSTLNDLAGKVELPVPAGGSVSFVLVYGMKESAGNEYQGKGFEASVNILAKQDTVEEDGFGSSQYDAGAVYPVSDTAGLQDALEQASDGDTISLTGSIVLDKTLSIKNDITIDGMGNAVISEQPVYVDEAASVTFRDVTFTQPDNANHNASSVYATGLSEKLVFEGCKFVDFQWEGIQITPVAGAEIVVRDCYFSNSKTMAGTGVETKRYFHVEVTDAATSADSVFVILENNVFENVVQSARLGTGYFSDSAVTIAGVSLENITCAGNVFKGMVAKDALTSDAIIWIQNGANWQDLSFEGFSIAPDATLVG